ncbi:MAG: DUF1667 domain-containing protein [Thermofilaceae archaeon]
MSEVELICILCPASCTLKVKRTDGGLEVEGYGCARGVRYARQELTEPLRHVMTVVRVRNGDLPVVSVVTRKPVPKECVKEVVKATAHLEVEAPVEIGQVVLEGPCGATLVATRRVRRVERREASTAARPASPSTP